MDKSPIIEIRSLCKTFGQFRAVDNLDITVNQGDIYGFLGPNGAGKSTTIRMLLSLISPTSGNISVFGHSLLTHRNQILSGIGAIVEKPDFYLYLTAEQNINILAKLHGIDLGIKEIHRALDQVGLLDRAKSKVKTFSYGMKQRLGISQALIHNPQLIILDEPTNGLDPAGIQEVRQLLRNLADQGMTVFVSSHLLSELEMISNHLVMLREGQVLFTGPIDQLLLAQKPVLVAKTAAISDLTRLQEIVRATGRSAEILNDEIGRAHV